MARIHKMKTLNEKKQKEKKDLKKETQTKKQN